MSHNNQLKKKIVMKIHMYIHFKSISFAYWLIVHMSYKEKYNLKIIYMNYEYNKVLLKWTI